MKTHLVLDEAFDYTPIFAGTAQECEEYAASQGIGFKVVHMNEQELRMHNPELVAKSGRLYRKVPSDVDIETWDAMTVVERLNHLGLIVPRENTDPI